MTLTILHDTMPTGLCELPDDLLLRILSSPLDDGTYLSPVDLLNVELSCRYFHRLADTGISLTNQVAKLIIEQLDPVYIESFETPTWESCSWIRRYAYYARVKQALRPNLCCGSYQNVYVNDLGRVYTWGAGRLLQLGDASVADREFPIAIKTVPRVVTVEGEPVDAGHVVHAAAGAAHSVLLTSQGYVFSFGDGRYYQLGHGTMKPCPSPSLVRTIMFASKPLSLYESKLGGVWGTVVDGVPPDTLQERRRTLIPISEAQLLRDQIASHDIELQSDANRISSPDAFLIDTNMSKEAFRQRSPIAQIAAGGAQTVFLTQSGVPLVVGNMVGFGKSFRAPMIPAGLLRVTIRQVAAGIGHTVFVCSRGQVFTMGNASEGQLGHGDFVFSTEPQPVKALTGSLIVSASAGTLQTLCVSATGKVYAFGCGREGRLGLGDEVTYPIPKQIDALKDKKIVLAAAGDWMSVFVDEDGGCTWCGTFMDKVSFLPRDIFADFGDRGFPYGRVSRAAVGSCHVVLLHHNGVLTSVGNNARGQTGHVPIGKAVPTLRPLVLRDSHPSLS
eukprot:Rmarinus@m.5546